MTAIRTGKLENDMYLATPTSDAATVTITNGDMPNAVKSVAVYDEDGTVLGYVALYTNGDLT